MTNQSLYSAFERFRQHILIALGNKSNIDHTHDTSDITSAFEQFRQHILTVLGNKSNIDHTHDTSDITSGVLDVEYGGTGHDSIVDTTYTTPRYRASALYSRETTPTTNGVINWMYE